jgi:hypothetical protein
VRTFSTFCVAVLSSASLFAQHGRVNPTPVFQGSFGNVVFPAGTAANPGVTRFFGNVVFPAGNPPKLYVPYSPQDPTRTSARFGPPNRGYGNGGYGYGYGSNRGRNGVVAVPYSVPIYIGGYAGYSGYYDGPPADQGAPPPQQPNVVVVYPAPAQSAAPPDYADYPPPPSRPVAPAPGPAPAAEQAPAEAGTQPYYLIAFKDHTIYSAVAYWVEGTTLHYFTSGANHNQVSLSLVDRELTERLNQEAGNNLQLPKE